ISVEIIMTTALIMAGGKGTRMHMDYEKPMIKVNDKPMIGYVIEALLESKYIDKILVAISTNTTHTREYVRKYPVTIVDTKAKGYLEDLSDILSNRDILDEDEVVMTIVADLPFIRSEQIDDVLNHYYDNDKPAMCVSVPEELFKKYNIKPTLVYEGLVPSGVNIVLANNNEQDQLIYVSTNVELAFNINTLDDLTLSKEYVKR
ncbi:MAG: NTP transferase domain-containing protein, partial [Methanosphaera sp.]|nr:NTP transferase domain-containing protein [Methanosphaera sp.]